MAVWTAYRRSHFMAEVIGLELRRLSWRRVRKAAGVLAEIFARFDLLTYSSAIAFQILYAVVPLSLLAAATASAVGERSLYTAHVAPTLRRDLSGNAYAIVNKTADRVMGPERYWWLTLGVLVTVWGVSAGLRALTTPLNAIYGVKEHRGWRRRLAISLAAGCLIVIGVLAALGVFFVGRLLGTSGFFGSFLTIARWVVVLGLLLVICGVVLRVVPAEQRSVAWVSVGSIVTCIAWIALTSGFVAYISLVSYASFYGALAAIILLLIYLHLAAIAFLGGVVADSQIERVIDAGKTRTS